MFDFSNLRTDPPRGTKVVQADTVCFRLQVTRTHTIFTIIKSGPDFEMYAATDISGRPLPYGSFIMRADELARLLRLIGYMTKPLEEK